MVLNDTLLLHLKKTAREAGDAILQHYSEKIDYALKEDETPITLADTASNTIINKALQPLGIPLISEENKNAPYETRKDWDLYWLIDPLDGTKEFLKGNGEFTVNIALCRKDRPVFGLIYVPVSGELFWGDAARKQAFVERPQQAPQQLIPPKKLTGNRRIRVMGSRSHETTATTEYLQDLETQYQEVQLVRAGSSLKFCRIAEGKADCYPRFGPTMEWDTAAGHAICNAVDIAVLRMEDELPLAYNKASLLNPNFMVRSL